MGPRGKKRTYMLTKEKREVRVLIRKVFMVMERVMLEILDKSFEWDFIYFPI